MRGFVEKIGLIVRSKKYTMEKVEVGFEGANMVEV
jgi:hypothetical protein